MQYIHYTKHTFLCQCTFILPKENKTINWCHTWKGCGPGVLSLCWNKAVQAQVKFRSRGCVFWHELWLYHVCHGLWMCPILSFLFFFYFSDKSVRNMCDSDIVMLQCVLIATNQQFFSFHAIVGASQRFINLPLPCSMFLFPFLVHLYLLYHLIERSDQTFNNTCIANAQRNAVKWYKYILANLIKTEPKGFSIFYQCNASVCFLAPK